jgi:hypothetical protein
MDAFTSGGDKTKISELMVPYLLKQRLKLTQSTIYPELDRLIALRILPRWFSQDWHCTTPEETGERMWFRPDATFAFCREEQARGVVKALARSDSRTR